MPFEKVTDIKSADGTRLALFRQQPAAAPKAEILLVHGFADHMGRYGHVAQAFVDAGYRVTGIDLRGHGRSDGKRGFVRAWSDYLADVDAAVAQIERPPILVSHSMGSLVVLDWLREHKAPGAVISSPLLKPRVAVPKWKVFAARSLTKVIPSLSLGNELNAADVSRHPDVVKAYETDPLVFHTATPRWYTEMVACTARVREFAPKYTTPALIQWGTGERIVDHDEVAAFAARYAGKVETKAWANLYHELFNEPERREILALATNWADRLVA